MKTQKAFQALLKKYQEGNCSPTELQELENWYNEGNKNPNNGLSEEMWEDDEDRFLETLNPKEEEPIKKVKMNWRMSILIAAAVLTIVGSFSIMFFKKSTPPTVQQLASDVDPGGNKATLTLENGKKIQLSDAKAGIVVDATKLTYDDGSLINNEQAQAFTISTPKGGTYKVKLPDGSNVWLNAASSLTYNPSLKGQELSRNVTLSGEAYFEVAKDKKHPFIVTTEKQKIEVLGTHFNISAYNDELSVKTTLVEGSVKVSPLKTAGSPAKAVILKPNQQSVVNSKGIQVNTVDPAEVIAWKDGEFVFVGEGLESIMLKISRWYNVDVEYTNREIANRPFSGYLSRYEKASQLLNLLEATGDVKFKIEGRRIIVMP